MKESLGRNLSMDDEKPLNYWVVWDKICWLGFTVLGMFFITFLCFPGLTVSLKPVNSKLGNGWFAILLITEFNVFDLIGRYTPGYTTLGFSRDNLMYLTVLRIAIYPCFVLLWLGKLPAYGVLNDDIYAYVLMALMAVTNGFIASTGMMWGPAPCEPHEKEVAGYFMVFMLQAGIFTGSQASLLIATFTPVGH